MLLVAALMIAAAGPAPQVDLQVIARTAVADATTSTEKVRAAIQWTHDNMDWTSTDYQKRTIEEIIERRGGNCREQAMVVTALLQRVGVKVRQIREVNIQPENPARARDSAELVRSTGPRASVFGLRHNDHVWIEYFDEVTGEWTPADPTLNLVGYSQWLQARVGFGARPTHAILPSRDMLVPFGVLAETGDPTHPFESRTARYLIEGFASEVPGAAQTTGWPTWNREISAIAPHVEAAFAGRYDLHKDDEQIRQIEQTYLAMKSAASTARL